MTDEGILSDSESELNEECVAADDNSNVNVSKDKLEQNQNRLAFLVVQPCIRDLSGLSRQETYHVNKDSTPNPTALFFFLEEIQQLVILILQTKFRHS